VTFLDAFFDSFDTPLMVFEAIDLLILNEDFDGFVEGDEGERLMDEEF